MGIKHTFVSSKADKADNSLVRPSNWNDDHTIDSDVDLNGYNLTNTGQIVNRNIQASLSNGVHSGMEVTINVDPTKIDISAGTYTVVDCWTDPEVPLEYDVTYAGATGLIVENLATANFSYIVIDKDQTISQLTEFPTDAQQRANITLAQIGHTNRTSVVSVNPTTEVFASPIDQLRDYWNFFAIANKGNTVSANGANLSINKASGYLFAQGANYYIDPKSPNTVTIAATVASTFRRRTQTGVGANGVTTLDVGNYDVAGTITATTGVKYTNQRAYLFPNGNLIIQYGQTQYTNMSNAIAAIPTETYIVYANIEGNAAFIGVISVRSTATDLSDTAQAIFTRIDTATGFPSGSSGTATTTLQQAYDNSITPEVLTDSTRGALSIKRGSAADTDNVLEGLNGAGATTFSVTGAGNIAGNNLSGTNTGDQDLSSLTTGAASSTDNAIARFDSITGKIIQNSAATIDDTGLITATGLDIALDQNDYTSLQVTNDDTTDINSRSRIAAIANHPIIGMIGGGVQAYGLHLDPSDSNNLKENFSSLVVNNPFRVVQVSSGITTLPRQPAFRAYNTTFVTNITGSGEVYAIICNTSLLNIGGSYSTSTGVFTAPRAGTYIFTAGVGLAGISTTTNTDYIYGLQSTDAFLEISHGAVNNTTMTFSGSFIVEMDASDTIYPSIQVNGSATGVDIRNAARITNFAGYLLG